MDEYGPFEILRLRQATLHAECLASVIAVRAAQERWRATLRVALAALRDAQQPLITRPARARRADANPE